MATNVRFPLSYKISPGLYWRRNLLSSAAILQFLREKAVDISLQPYSRCEVRLRVKAERSGTAYLQAIVSAAGAFDAIRVDFPVQEPVSYECTATCGEMSGAVIEQPVNVPGEVHQDAGGLEIELSSTALTNLKDAYLYLRDYSYGCTEQLASKLFSLVCFEPLMRELSSTPLRDRSSQIDSILEKLLQRQCRDGGFNFWNPKRRSHSYLSLYIF